MTEDKATSRRRFIVKIAQIQRELNAPKNQYNKFGKYSYRSCEDIMTGLKPFLDDLIVFMNDEVVQIGDRYYIKATVTITDGENEVTNSALAREALTKKGMDDAQITGSCSSYARKYALAGMFLIDDNRDADAHDNRNNNHRNNNRSANPQHQPHTQQTEHYQPPQQRQNYIQPAPSSAAASGHNVPTPQPEPAPPAQTAVNASPQQQAVNQCGTAGKVLTPNQVQILKSSLQNAGVQETELLGVCGVNRIGQMQGDWFEGALKWVNKRKTQSGRGSLMGRGIAPAASSKSCRHYNDSSA